MCILSATNADRSELGFARLVGCARRRVTFDAFSNVKAEVNDDKQTVLDLPPPGLMNEDDESTVVSYRSYGPLVSTLALPGRGRQFTTAPNCRQCR